MRFLWLLLSSFFLLFIVSPSSILYAKIDDVKVKMGKDEGPVEIEADELIYDREKQIYYAHGQVEVVRGNLSLKGDHAQLNHVTKEVTAWGNVLFREDEDVIECERLEINLDTRLGKISKAVLFLKDQNFHITGQEVEKLGENHYRVRDGLFTTCDADRPPWKFTAKELEIKKAASGGSGTATGIMAYIENIPFFYFPAGIFSARSDRQTGFLLSKVAYSNKYGPEIKTGFFWAFAKDMDATLNFDWLGTRGFKEGLEYRYALTKDTHGKANFYFIDDQVYHGNRYAFFVQHEQKLPYDFYLKGDINRISDNQYLRDFPEDFPRRTKIDSESSRQLRSNIFGGKNWDQFSFLAETVVYDNLERESNAETIQKLPKISFYAQPQSLFKTPLFYDFTSSYVNFWRKRGVEAQRGDILPTVSYPMRLFNVLKLESNIGLRETLYRVSEDPTQNHQGLNSRETFDAGAEVSTEFYRVYNTEGLSKISNLYGVAKWMHTIEPKISYGYNPRVNQSRLPFLDEVDRIPYTNQITYGITQRLLGKPERISSGPSEYGKLTIFQSYSLGDPITRDEKGKARSFSNIQAELWWNFGPYVSSRWDMEFNPYRGIFQILNASLTAKDLRNDVVQVQYRYTKDNVTEINLDTRIKTFPPLYLFGSLRYNLLSNWLVVGIYGAEYQAQCWNLGFKVENWGQSPDGAQQKEMKYEVYFSLLNIGAYGQRPYQMTL